MGHYTLTGWKGEIALRSLRTLSGYVQDSRQGETTSSQPNHMRYALQIVPLDHRDATLIGAVQNIACPAWLHEKEHVTPSGREKKIVKGTRGRRRLGRAKFPRRQRRPVALGQSQAESQTAALRHTGHNC